MFTAIYGCDKYGAYIDGEFRKACTPHGMPNAFFYFISYTTFSSFIVLSIFLGVIQIAMDEAQENMQEYTIILTNLNRLRLEHPDRNSYILLLLEAFQCLDSNSSRQISLQELCDAVCGVQMDNNTLVEYFTSMDEDGDRKIDAVEFVKFVSVLGGLDDDEPTPTSPALATHADYDLENAVESPVHAATPTPAKPPPAPTPEVSSPGVSALRSRFEAGDEDTSGADTSVTQSGKKKNSNKKPPLEATAAAFADATVLAEEDELQSENGEGRGPKNRRGFDLSI
jgi:hypothetical protein